MNKEDIKTLQDIGLVPIDIECLSCFECILMAIKELKEENAALKARLEKEHYEKKL